MSELYKRLAEEYLFWIIAGGASVGSLIEYYKSKSWGKTASVFILGMAVGWAVTSIPTVKEKVGQALMWIIGLLKFG
ncbi:hypothetical protein ACVRZR_06440 [Streptococcus entericus]|uniref:hypothetical protein n=1 Tax=Streptococcus entericus TaxID=155680 RepID=UPI00036163D9|nr:hypothetical protein [Streptococcus entericus]